MKRKRGSRNFEARGKSRGKRMRHRKSTLKKRRNETRKYEREGAGVKEYGGERG